MSESGQSGDSSAAPVTFDPAVPLHHQVYLHLRREIADGLWQGRDDFPGEREVAERLGISVITSRAALDRLADDGWIERRRGRRPRILYRIESAGDRVTEAGPSIFEFGPFRPYAYRVLLAETRIAPAEACAAFGVPAGERLWQCMRARTAGGKPHSVTHNVQDPDVGEQHTADELAQEPMVQLLTRAGHSIHRLRRRFGVVRSPALVTEALGLTIAEQVLVATFTLHRPDDSVLEWVRIYLHPDQSTPEETMEFTTGTWSAAEYL
jgi:GntR family transcriptional regulator